MAKTAWTDEALQAAVDVYLDMYFLQQQGQPFVKKQYYRQLHERFPNYSESSFEHRMQNISYLFFLRGRAFVQGLKPLSHLGANIVLKLDDMIEEAFWQRCQISHEDSEQSQAQLDLAFENTVLNQNPEKEQPQGCLHPKLWRSHSTSFQRDPKVKAWVLAQAQGKCEYCHQDAPFLAFSQKPYLEVHHVKPLADGGADTVNNAVALCPNCHREIHYSDHIQHMDEELYATIDRLQRA